VLHIRFLELYGGSFYETGKGVSDHVKALRNSNIEYPDAIASIFFVKLR